MSPSLKIVIISGASLLSVISGIILGRFGKPYNMLMLNVHKFISLFLVVFSIFFVRSIISKADVNGLSLFPIILSVVFTLVIIITGGVLSARPESLKIVWLLHSFLPLALFASFAFSLYMIFRKG